MNYVDTIRQKIGHDPLMLIGANVIILDDNSKVLLQKRPGGSWGLPGGLSEINERLEDTARREVLEETGIYVDKVQLIDLFSGPEYFFNLDNNDQIYVITVLYLVNKYHGIMEPDGVETKQLQYFSLEDLPDNIEDEYLHYLEFYREWNAKKM